MSTSFDSFYIYFLNVFCYNSRILKTTLGTLIKSQDARRITMNNKPKEYKELYKGIALMLIAAALGCIGQMIWKAVMSAGGSPVYIAVGFALYGLGAVAMIIALRYGPLSVLHPMNSAGYILSLFLGAFVLHEHVTPLRILGVIVIALGLIVISRDGKVLIESPYDSNGRLKSQDKNETNSAANEIKNDVDFVVTDNAAAPAADSVVASTSIVDNTQDNIAASATDNTEAFATSDTPASTDKEADA